MKWLAVILSLTAGMALAVEPGEILDDPLLEARARALSSELRCPVCQSENIDESRAPIARDLRLLVRERLVAGDSDDAVLDYVAARFGEEVLMRPQARGWGWLLWLAGPLIFVAAAGIAVLTARQRRTPEPLNDAERQRLAEITGR